LSMKKILNWGLLSTARINRALILPLRVSNRNRLLAVGSRSLESAESYAKDKGINRAHGTYESLLADPDIDVIYNPLPNHLHAEWTIKSVEAGKHVLCEKPLALSVDEVDAIKSAARAHDRVVAEAFMYRHHPQTLKVLDMVRNGSIGVLKLIRGAFSFMLTRENDVRLNPNWGGGSIWDVGCYPISFARTVVGERPVDVSGWQSTGPTGIDMTFIGQMRFANGVLAQFDSSFELPFRTELELVGSEGILRIPKPFKPQVNEEIHLTKHDRTETIIVKGQELYIGEVEDMADSILLGRHPRISLDDSRENVAVIKACLESAQTGVPVTL